MDSESKRQSSDDVYDLWGEDYFKLKDDFPTIHRNSTLIMIYAAFEEELKYICIGLDSIVNCGINPYSWRDDILGKAEKFITNNTKKEYSLDKNNWNSIKNIRKIRNKIVHNSCFIDNSDKDNKDTVTFLINKNLYLNDLTIRDANLYKIKLNNDFLYEVIKIFDEYFNQLIGSASRVFN